MQAVHVYAQCHVGSDKVMKSSKGSLFGCLYEPTSILNNKLEFQCMLCKFKSFE